MWGLNSIQSLQQAATNLANQSLASATQLLEKLDGEFDEIAENDDEDANKQQIVDDDNSANLKFSSEPKREVIKPHSHDPLDEIEIDDDTDLAPANLNEELAENIKNKGSDRNENQNSALADIEFKLSDALKEINLKDQEIQHLREHNKNLKEKGKKVSQQKQDINTALQSAMSEFSSKEDKYKADYNDLQSKLDEFKHAFDNAESTKNKLMQENMEYLSQIDKLLKENEDLNLIISKDNVEDASDPQLLNKLEELKCAFDSSESAKSKLQHENLDHLSHIDKLEEAIEHLNTTIAQHLIEKNEMELTISQFNDTKTLLTNQVRGFMLQIENARNETASRESLIELLTSKLETIQQAHDSKVNDSSNNEQIIHDQEIHIQQLIEENKSLQSQIIDLQAEEMTHKVLSKNDTNGTVDDKETGDYDSSLDFAAASAKIDVAKTEAPDRDSRSTRQKQLQAVEALKGKLESVRSMQLELQADVAVQLDGMTKDFIATSHKLIEKIPQNTSKVKVHEQQQSVIVDDSPHEEELRAMKTRYEESELKSTEYYNLMKKFESDISYLESQRNELSEELMIVKSTLQTSSETIHDLELELESLKFSHTENLEAKAVLENKCITLTAELEDTSKSITGMHESQDKILDLEEQVRQLRGEAENKTSQLDELQKSFDITEEKLRHYIEVSVIDRDSKNDVLEQHEMEVKALQEKIRNIEQSNAELVASLQSKASSVTEANLSYATKLEELESLLSEHIVNNATLTQDLIDMEASKDKMQSTLMSLQSDNVAISKQHEVDQAEYDKKIADLTNQFSIMFDEQSLNKQKLLEQAALLEEKTAKIVELSSLLSASQDNINVMESLRCAMAELREKNALYEEESQKLEGKKRRDLENLKKQNEMMMQLQREKLTMEEHYSDQITELQNSHSASEFKISELNCALDASHQERNLLQNELEKLNHQIVALKTVVPISKDSNDDSPTSSFVVVEKERRTDSDVDNVSENMCSLIYVYVLYSLYITTILFLESD